MPTYDYRCAACGRGFEIFQRMSDPPGAECPGCGEEAERLISGGAGFLFKGEGFYITDHRSDDYRKKERAEGGAGDSGKKEARSAASGDSSPGPDGAGSAAAAKFGKDASSAARTPGRGMGKGTRSPEGGR